MSVATSAPLPIAQARSIVADLTTPKPVIFWADFLLSLTIGYGAATVYMQAPVFSAAQIVSYFVAGFALFRLALFMHEIVHFRQGEMTGFTMAWNVLAGIPMLIPTFLYESHLMHHNSHHYGTGNDGEYLPLGIGGLRNILGFLAQILFLPAFVALRFLVLAPISFLHPQLRKWVLERWSSYVINFSYRRAVPENAPRVAWAALEVACFLRTLVIFSFVLASEIHLFGMTIDMSWARLPKLYCLAMFTLGLNHVRTLVAHRFQSIGCRMTHEEQFNDSVNVEGRSPLSELLFPVGLRYHALHHLFPLIPYHNLGTAHRRLLEQLPQGSAYHRATYPSFWAAVRDLLKCSREACATPPPGSDLWYARRREMNAVLVPEIGDEYSKRRQPIETSLDAK